MTFSPGTRLGPYEILAPLGAGGMGEVYRARDTRLNRDVAVKVLPEEFFEGEERRSRFRREATLLASLNHPGIAAIYSFEEIPGPSSSSAPSRNVLVMELIEGQTLRKVFSAGPLPLKKLLAVAAQIAEGLAKAHEAGIVHRDLKPENVMVTKDGAVKILDFGLAKFVEPPSAEGERTQTATASLGTEAGVVLGTILYMSPEQALGEKVDYRTDQFSFGSMLYEMATGKRAFPRASAPEAMAAIIREEPAPMASITPDLPLPLRWIVERCLAKDPEDRYASTKDLARDLARLRDGASDLLSSGGTRAAAPPARRVGRLVALAGALMAGALLAALALRKPAAGPPAWRALTFRRGSIGGARFAPDGKTVVYAAAWQGQPAQLYTTRVDSTESTALPLPSANLASVSSKGMLAIVLPREPAAVIAEVSLAGGAPRELVDGAWFSLPGAPAVADWAPGGTGLAVVRNWQVEFPVGKVLVPGRPYDGAGHVRFSPDGRRIAYSSFSFAKGHLLGVTDLDGNRKILCDGLDYAASLAWHPRTGEIWFSARERGSPFGAIELQAVSLSGKRRVILRAPTALVEDIAPDGRVLVRSDESPTTMTCLPPGASHEVDLSWQDFSTGIDLSDDGRELLFTETGVAGGAKGAVYMRRTDGSAPAVRLGEGRNARGLSPDRQWVVEVSPDRIVLLPVGAGEARTIRDEGLEYRTAAWFRDGQRLLVEAAAPGNPPRLWVRNVVSGPLHPITAGGFRFAALSPDGKTVAATDASGGAVLVPVAGGPPEPLPGLSAGDRILRFDATGKNLFVYGKGISMRIERLEIATGQRTIWKEISLSDPTGVDRIFNAQLTPDGACYCYSYTRNLTRLYVVEGLR
ncbi:MAG: serine/threonine-protein kinase [Acidobacteriota bacterium]